MPSEHENVHHKAPPKSALWALRDNRTLSEHAKIAYVMLWLRGDDAHPSMQTLAADMGASVRTARNAIRELEEAGALKTAARKRVAGNNDTNQYELLSVLGEAPPAAPSALSAVAGTAPRADEDRTLKTESEGRNSRASRRGRTAQTRNEDKVACVQRAFIVHGWDLRELDDEIALDIWARFIEDRVTDAPVVDPVKLLGKVFRDHVSLDGVLSNTAERDAS